MTLILLRRVLIDTTAPSTAQHQAFLLLRPALTVAPKARPGQVLRPARRLEGWLAPWIDHLGALWPAGIILGLASLGTFHDVPLPAGRPGARTAERFYALASRPGLHGTGAPSTPLTSPTVDVVGGVDSRDVA